MFSLISGIGDAVKLIGKPLSKVLHLLPKGTASGVGGVVGALGAAGLAADHYQWFTDPNLAGNLRAVAEVLTALGTVIASFGLGRHEQAQS